MGFGIGLRLYSECFFVVIFDEYYLSSSEVLEWIIIFVYRQVYGNLFFIENECCIFFEVCLMNGEIIVCDFVNGLVKFFFYKENYFYSVVF